jgi:glycosyltransferase involved in cell wall biosynthesis
MLLIAGQDGWKHEPVHAAADRLGVRDAVRFLGYVPTSQLVALYNLADAFLFPSLYEGFGLPVVEAMACGLPVVTSRGSSLGEIAAGAAVLVEPGDVGSIEEGIRCVLQDESLRQTLRARGLARAADFSWADAAAQTRQVYESARGK